MHRPTRARIATGLAIAGLLLTAAAPARAADEKQPVDEHGNKGCPYRMWDGGVGYYPHGTTITVITPTGSRSVRCNNGNWDPARADAAPLITAPVGAIKTLP
jgi:hypothetical protein